MADPARELDDFTETTFTHGGKTRTVYRTGTGPAVIVIHEMPGITPEVAEFGRRVAAAGFSAVLPVLFGEPGRPLSAGYTMKSIVPGCVSKEFAALATRRTSPITVWLRALGTAMHEECGGPGIGAVGMCFTGGFALAMMVDAPVVAPVLAQPSAPFAVSPRRARDVNLSPRDLEIVRRRVAQGCAVLGLRFERDPAVGRRFDRYREEFGEKFIAVEFPGRHHNTLTEQRQQEGVDRVLDFLSERLHG
jgi:dienelactone hydrolase